MRTADQFWARVDRSSPDGCHLWLGAKNNSGYGTVNWRGTNATAHRLAAFLLGVVDSVACPTDRTGSGFILHQCDEPACCNPAHWKIGTYTENQKEAYARGRRAARRGDKHANAKLTAAQAVDIRRRWPAETQTKLALEYGVSQRVVSKVVRRETYV